MTLPLECPPTPNLMEGGNKPTMGILSSSIIEILPSSIITIVSHMIRNVVKATSNENTYVQMGSAILYSG